MTKTKNVPIIGIVPSFDHGLRIPAGGGNVKRIYLRYEYTKMIAQIGAVPLVLNHDMPLDSITDLCDGIIISGGEDINPRHYGEKRLAAVRVVEPSDRFEWEKDLIEACDSANIPILGICYGLQRLNVHYGGTLVQDIPTYYPDNIGHDTTVHPIRIEHEFLGLRANTVVEISSRHHQSVDRLAEDFKISATAPDGIIEAIEGHGHFGMQWHPESDETGAHVYRAFVEHCMRNWIV